MLKNIKEYEDFENEMKIKEEKFEEEMRALIDINKILRKDNERLSKIEKELVGSANNDQISNVLNQKTELETKLEMSTNENLKLSNENKELINLIAKMENQMKDKIISLENELRDLKGASRREVFYI